MNNATHAVVIADHKCAACGWYTVSPDIGGKFCIRCGLPLVITSEPEKDKK